VITEYLSDGVHLYEIVAERAVRNYGLRGGTIRTVILRDVVTETIAPVGDIDLLALTPVPHERGTE